MFSSSWYQMVVLLLTLIMAVQLVARGMHDGSFELQLMIKNSGGAQRPLPEQRPVAKKSEDVKKRNEQDRSPNPRPNQSDVWFVGY